MQPERQTSHAPSTALSNPFRESNGDVISDLTFDELRELGHGVGLGLDLEASLNNDWISHS